jgi:hypothetical protein
MRNDTQHAGIKQVEKCSDEDAQLLMSSIEFLKKKKRNDDDDDD